jgi:RNA polymerase sigma-70 factor (ECF subfamily)
MKAAMGSDALRAASAFAEWARPSLLAMTHLARRLAPPSEVDDVVQDALTRAWQKWSTYDPTRGTPTVWLLAIVADRSRSARVAKVRSLRVVDDFADVPERPVLDTLSDIDLDRAIDGLSDRQQLAVHLHYFVGLNVDDCAAVMGCSPGTVKSTLFDARNRLREKLEVRDD